MKRALFWAACVVAVGIVLVGVTAVPLRRQLADARAALTAAERDPTGPHLQRALRALRAAEATLERPSARVARLIPVVRPNLEASAVIAEGLEPVVRAGLRARHDVESVASVLFSGHEQRQVAALGSLEATLLDERQAVAALDKNLAALPQAWLVPPVYDAVTELQERAASLSAGVDHGLAMLDVVPGLLGHDRPQRYLIMLINNAEARGAGGALTGVGTLVAGSGSLRLGELYSVHELQDEPPRPVPAPAEYERRFARFDANTTLWLNATYSPDVPDAALVAQRLFRLTTGRRTQGAIVIDPRGLAAVMPEGEPVRVKGIGSVDDDDLPRVVYSEAYEAFTDQTKRQNAILEVGKRAFGLLLRNGLSGGDALARAGTAVSGGHLRFVPSTDRAADAARPLGLTGQLPDSPGDAVLVTTQNFGDGRGEGTKLDYWVRRHIEHGCRVTSTEADCATTVRLKNFAPRGLTRYVAGRPYALLRNYVEIYVPERATIGRVTRNGNPVDYRSDRQGTYVPIGVYSEIPRGDSMTLNVTYELPVEDAFKLVVVPQPLARDATIELGISLPSGWSASGLPLDDGVLRYSGRLAHTIDVTARPETKPGLAGLWNAFTRFWKDPVF